MPQPECEHWRKLDPTVLDISCSFLVVLHSLTFRPPRIASRLRKSNLTHRDQNAQRKKIDVEETELAQEEKFIKLPRGPLAKEQILHPENENGMLCLDEKSENDKNCWKFCKYNGRDGKLRRRNRNKIGGDYLKNRPKSLQPCHL